MEGGRKGERRKERVGKNECPTWRLERSSMLTIKIIFEVEKNILLNNIENLVSG